MDCEQLLGKLLAHKSSPLIGLCVTNEIIGGRINSVTISVGKDRKLYTFPPNELFEVDLPKGWTFTPIEVAALTQMAEADMPTDADIVSLARTFMHEPETWEYFESLKESSSVSLPVDFSNLGYAIEQRFGAPDQIRDEDMRKEAGELVNRALVILEKIENANEGTEERGRCWLEVALTDMDRDSERPRICGYCQESLFHTKVDSEGA